MARGEHGAAVFIRFDADIEGVDFARNDHDLVFVHADAGAEHRKRGALVGTLQGVDGLACHLPEAFAGDQRVAALPFGDTGGHLHHQPPHRNGEHLFGAVVPDRLLQLGKVHGEQVHATGVGRHLFKQAVYLLLRQRGGVRGRREVHGGELDPAFRHHIRRHRGIDSARDQHAGAPAGAGWHAARAGQLRAVDVGVAVAHLHVHGHLGLVHVHFDAAEGRKHGAAHLVADGGGIIREALIGTLCLHLEGLGEHQLVL